MCKSWSIKYSCEHICRFRLSTCRGTFTTRPRPDKEPKAMCSTLSTLVFLSQSRCGACERASVEEAMAKNIDDIRARVALKSLARFEDEPDFEEDVVPVNNKELMAAEEERETFLFRSGQMYPDVTFKRYRVPEKGVRMTSNVTSKLRHEVLVDDIDTNSGIEECNISEEDVDWYSGWADWTIPNDRVVDIDKACKDWMESEDEDDIEADSTTPEWSLNEIENATPAPPSATTDNVLPTEAADIGLNHDRIEFEIREPQPCSVNPTISTILANSEKTKPLDATGPTVEHKELDKENIDPASSSATTTQTFGKENVIPTVRYKANALPPHLRRKRSFMLRQQQSNGKKDKAEAEILEHMRCWNYSLVSVST